MIIRIAIIERADTWHYGPVFFRCSDVEVKQGKFSSFSVILGKTNDGLCRCAVQLVVIMSAFLPISWKLNDFSSDCLISSVRKRFDAESQVFVLFVLQIDVGIVDDGTHVQVVFKWSPAVL